MELVAVGEHRETTQDILDDLFVMWGVGPVLGVGEKLFDSFDVVTSAVDRRCHGDLRRVHIMVEGSALFLVGNGLSYGCGFRFLKGYRFAHVVVVECHYHVGVKAQYIAVANAVGDAVSVQAFAEHHGCCGALFLVLVKNRRSREAEEQRIGECLAYILKHVAKGGSVALVDDEYDALGCEAVEFRLGNSALAGLHVAHFLDGSDDKAILGVVAGEL